MPKRPITPADLLPEITSTLEAAQGERSTMQAVDEWSGEPLWVQHERSVMADVTCSLVIRHGGRAPMDEVVAAVKATESSAVGHSDYTRKWSLRCAEFVISKLPAQVS